MKRFIKTALTVVLAAAAVSCAKEIEPQKENINGTIDLTITGAINGYTPQEETKAEAQTVVRIMWKGDETVYVFDGTERLGSLTASIEGTDGTYAKLSGTIRETEATTLTFVYSPQFDEEPDVTEGGKISLDLSTQNGEEVPFLIYATLPTAQAPTSFSNEVVQFNLATSVFKCNCAGLGEDGEISQAAISGVNTKCELTLSNNGAPEVSGTTPGTITRTDGFTKADQRAIFSVALPKTDESVQDRTIEVTKGGRTFTASYPKRAFDISKSFNSVFALEAVPYSAIPFTITSSGSTTVAIKGYGEELNTISLKYRTDSIGWTDYVFTPDDEEAVGEEILLNDGDFVQFQAGQSGNDGFSKGLEEDSYHITVDGDGTVSASGNIMSLVDSTLERTNLNEYIFAGLFVECENLTDASNLVLPATTLAAGCYAGMFALSGLTTAPALPADKLAKECYYMMFSYCTSLTAAPALPATTLADSCYYAMFLSCASLTTAPALPATKMEKECYLSMFENSGLTTAPALPATELAESCYSQMFQSCLSLAEAPVLPAITLKNDCYQFMFTDCGNLNYLKALFTTTPGADYTEDWLSGVASTGTFVMNSSATWLNIGNDGIPEGWTVEKLGSTETDPEETVL